MDQGIINKTGKAVVAITLMVFCIVTIIWLLLYGQPGNSLHASALSWSYTVLVVAAGALGLDTAIAKLLPSMVAPTQTK